MEKYVRLNTWASKAQKAFIKKEAEKQSKERGVKVSESELVREALYKVYKVK